MPIPDDHVKEETIKPLLRELLPDLAAELDACLRAEGEHLVANGVDFLRIYDLCECDDSQCGSFYTGPKPEGTFGAGHRTLLLDPAIGMMLLDVVDRVVRYVELIDRPEIHLMLRGA